MAWRPTEYLIEGELDNRNPDKVTGWMKFAGLKEKVTFDLEGNFHRDIRGANIRFTGDAYEDQKDVEGEKYMEGFSLHQTGSVGDITAGIEPVDYVNYPYFEWYGAENGRVVIELEQHQVELLSMPIPACESDPIDRKKQAENMAGFLSEMASACGIPEQNAIAIGNTLAVERAKKAIANEKIASEKFKEVKNNE